MRLANGAEQDDLPFNPGDLNPYGNSWDQAGLFRQEGCGLKPAQQARFLDRCAVRPVGLVARVALVRNTTHGQHQGYRRAQKAQHPADGGSGSHGAKVCAARADGLAIFAALRYSP